jgi:hypothetical protein
MYESTEATRQGPPMTMLQAARGDCKYEISVPGLALAGAIVLLCNVTETTHFCSSPVDASRGDGCLRRREPGPGLTTTWCQHQYAPGAVWQQGRAVVQHAIACAKQDPAQVVAGGQSKHFGFDVKNIIFLNQASGPACIGDRRSSIRRVQVAAHCSGGYGGHLHQPAVPAVGGWPQRYGSDERQGQPIECTYTHCGRFQD